MKTIIRYFLQGLLFVVPITVTAYVIYKAFVVLDGLIPFSTPGLGILLIFILITLTGVLGGYFITSPLFSYFDRLLNRAPLIKIIYSSVKDLVSAFVGQKKSFNKPVLVRLYENSEIRRIGFITAEDLSGLGLDNDFVTIYMPHSYAISGQVFIVPRSYITPLDIKAAMAMKYIISGGVTRLDDDV